MVSCAHTPIFDTSLERGEVVSSKRAEVLESVTALHQGDRQASLIAVAKCGADLQIDGGSPQIARHLFDHTFAPLLCKSMSLPS